MEKSNTIVKAINFMEQNLKEEIDLRDIANHCCYSTFHFSRLFQIVTNESPISYLRKRRLCEAAKEVLQNKKRILDIAIDYQFGSQESFSRAYKDFFGLAPSESKKHIKSILDKISSENLLLNKALFGFKEVTMKPRIEEKPEIFAIGYPFYGNPEEGRIPHLWDLFNDRVCELDFVKPDSRCIGIEFYTKDYEKTGDFFYICSVIVDNLNNIPIDMVAKKLPASKYAVFTYKGTVEKLKDTYTYIYGTWLPNSGYKMTKYFDFELYIPEKFKGIDNPDTEFEIWIPID